MISFGLTRGDAHATSSFGDFTWRARVVEKTRRDFAVTTKADHLQGACDQQDERTLG